MNFDYRDLLRLFNEHGVKYLVVGAYAVIHYTQPRYTKDLDLWVRPTKENAQRLMVAMAEFGIPLADLDVTQSDFEVEGTQLYLGVAPNAIAFLTSLPEMNFAEAWVQREVCDEDGLRILSIGKSDLIQAKQNAGRLQDLADIEEINRLPPE